MKLKFICHPQQSIWLKKLISKSLVIGLLFNTTLSSFAGILSEDERYETFEGNNITIDNILEEDKVDIEIEGNTLVNLSHIRNYQCGPASHNYNHKLKPNTTYTFITDVSNVKGNPECVLMRITYKDGTFQSISDKIHTSNEKIIIKFTTQNKDIDRYYFGWIRNYVENETLLTMNDTMLLEGDWTNKEIPEYFEGMKSVGELEDNKIEIKSQNKNLFNIHKVYSEGYGGRKDEAYIEVVNNSLFISKKNYPWEYGWSQYKMSKR